MEKKTNPEKPISKTGCHIFDGNLTLRMGGKEYKVRCEYFGLDLQRASQEHQIVMLIRQHLPYGELDTGWLVRAKDLDKNHQFGLKACKTDRGYPVYKYTDVVAWGYIDGGCNNPNHFDSCRMRPEDYPQWAGKQQDEDESPFMDEFSEEDIYSRKCVKLRFENGEVHVNATFAADEEVVDPETKHAKGLFHACAKAFYDFREQHPEVTEMHFYTDEELEMES